LRALGDADELEVWKVSADEIETVVIWGLIGTALSWL
jgi:hypothetical protein